MVFAPRYPLFLSVQESCRTGCMWTVLGWLKLSRFEPTELAHLDYHVWVSCTKSTINSSRLMSWKSPCRSPGKSCHKNTLTRQWQTSSSAWLPSSYMAVAANGDHFEHLRVTLSISKSASSCHHQQTGSFLSEPPTDYQWKRRSERWEMVVSVRKSACVSADDSRNAVYDIHRHTSHSIYRLPRLRATHCAFNSAWYRSKTEMRFTTSVSFGYRCQRSRRAMFDVPGID